MVLVGQTIPHRNTGILCKIFYNLLTISTILDSVEHSSQNSGSILNAFLFTDLRT